MGDKKPVQFAGKQWDLLKFADALGVECTIICLVWQHDNPRHLHLTAVTWHKWLNVHEDHATRKWHYETLTLDQKVRLLHCKMKCIENKFGTNIESVPEIVIQGYWVSLHDSYSRTTAVYQAQLPSCQSNQIKWPLGHKKYKSSQTSFKSCLLGFGRQREPFFVIC